MEYTDPDVYAPNCLISEICVILAGGDLKKQHLIGDFVIRYEGNIGLDNLIKNDFVATRHKENGLWEEIQNPQKSVSLQEAEKEIIKQLSEHGIIRGSIPSAGIQAYNDRILIENTMPELDKFLHFMIIDVTSVDETASRWNKRVFKKRDGQGKGLRARDNIQRAIKSLQYYKNTLFKTKEKKQN
eukprot:403353283